ncbi:MAG: hypothetical protein GTO41_25315, partial [Burkholderiales bacterium]|nr:hypothetical protein [Burkholderiales bacterium]
MHQGRLTPGGMAIACRKKLWLLLFLPTTLVAQAIDFNPLPHNYVVLQDGVETADVATRAEAENLAMTLKTACGSCDVKYITPGSYQVAVVAPPPLPTGEETGLDFPGNAAVSSTMRFRFRNPLPIYPATYIWRVYPRFQACHPGNYYTIFFWGNDDGQGNLDTFLWKGNGEADTYYGAHPFPDPSPCSSTHKWEIAIEQNDFLSPQAVQWDRWYTQAFVAWDDGNNKRHIYYWDLDDPNLRVERVSAGTWGNDQPPFPYLTFGDAPWADAS